MRKKIGQIIAALALALLIRLGIEAFSTDATVVSHRFVFLSLLDLLMGIVAVRLLGDAYALSNLEEHTTGHVDGVRETVDRLASVLKDSRT